MWERFTERAKHVISEARLEACRAGSEDVRAEHVLLGLCLQPEGAAAQALQEVGVDTDALVAEIRRQPAQGDSLGFDHTISFSNGAKKALELAVQEARLLDHDHIGTEHLLLGLIQLDEEPAVTMLAGAGVDSAATRTLVLALHRLDGGQAQ